MTRKAGDDEGMTLSSEDWKTVVTLVITTIGGIVATVLTSYAYLEIIRRRLAINDRKTDAAAVMAKDAASASTLAAEKAAETQKGVNGRLDELVKSEHDRGVLEGKSLKEHTA